MKSGFFFYICVNVKNKVIFIQKVFTYNSQFKKELIWLVVSLLLEK